MNTHQRAALDGLQQYGPWRSDNPAWVVGDARTTTSLLDSLVKRGFAFRDVASNGSTTYRKAEGQ